MSDSMKDTGGFDYGTEVGMLSNNTIAQYSNSVFGIAGYLL